MPCVGETAGVRGCGHGVPERKKLPDACVCATTKLCGQTLE